MAFRVSVGSAEVLVVSDGVEDVELRHIYAGLDGQAFERIREYAGPDGRHAMPFACYVIRADGRTTLVDTGWGDNIAYAGSTHGGRLMADLDDAGVRPEDVDLVTFTHLHVDHVGWNLAADGSSARFPRARYLLPKADVDFFAAGRGREQNFPHEEDRDTSYARCIAPLFALGVVDTFDGETALAPSVVAIPTPGHTPGHTSFLISSGGERLFLLGDVSLTPADAADPDLHVVFDEERERNCGTRRQVLERLEAEGTLTAVSHYLAPGVGRFVRHAGRRGWEATSAATWISAADPGA